MNVTYKPVLGFPAYRVGSDGSVWTCRRKGGNDHSAERLTQTWRRMKLHRHNGYYRVNLIHDGKNHTRAAHCLVLEAFVGPCPPGMEACHFPDNDRANNNLENLRWDTHTENMRDKYRAREGATSKTCRRCGRELLLIDFYADKRAMDGRKTECKACHMATARATRDPQKKRECNRILMRAYRQEKRKVATGEES